MTARSSIGIVCQIGVETTPGTNVTTTKKLPSLDIKFTPRIGSKFHRTQGQKLATQAVRNKHASDGTFSGPLSYSELTYILGSLVGAASTTQIGATGAYTWLFTPTNEGADPNAKTFTIQRGDSEAAQEVAYGQFLSLHVEMSRDDAMMSGALHAYAIDNSVTLDVGATLVEKRPVSGADFDVYLDSTFGGLGTTKITDCYKVTIDIPEKFGEKWVMNTSHSSFKEGVDKLYEPTIDIEAEFNAQTRALYDALNADSLPERFVQVKAIGDNLGASADETFKFDCAVRLATAEELEDIEGVYGYRFRFRIVSAATFLGGWKCTLVNKLSAY